MYRIGNRCFSRRIKTLTCSFAGCFLQRHRTVKLLIRTLSGLYQNSNRPVNGLSKTDSSV